MMYSNLLNKSFRGLFTVKKSAFFGVAVFSLLFASQSRAEVVLVNYGTTTSNKTTTVPSQILVATPGVDPARLTISIEDQIAALQISDSAQNTDINDLEILADHNKSSIQDLASSDTQQTEDIKTLGDQLGHPSTLGNDDLSKTNLAYSGATISAHLSGLDSSIGQIHEMATEGNLDQEDRSKYSGRTSVANHLTALDTSIGNRSTLNGDNLTAGANVVTNLQALNDGIEDLNDTFDARAAVAAGNITAAQYKNSSLESFVTGTANKAIDPLQTEVAKLRDEIGHPSYFGDDDTTRGNLAYSGATISAHLGALDHRLGQIGGLAASRGANYKGNLAENTNAFNDTVSSHLSALDDAIGDRSAISGKYLSTGGSVTSNLQSLNTGVENVERQVDDLDDKVRGGFASVAALSGLVPNARATGGTQISLGTGAYRNKAGLAVGGFHYINDNVLLNVGASYGGEKSTIVKGGVTLGW